MSRRHAFRRWSATGRGGALLVLWVVFLTPRPLPAHELSEAAATVVVRDGGHIELRLLVPWAELLHRRLMPDRSMMDFLARVTAEPTPALSGAVAAVVADVQRATLLLPDGRQRMPFGGWRWPGTDAVRAALREELMARLTGGTETHPSRLTTTAELVRPAGGAVRVTFGRVFGPVLLTVVHPEEEWVAPGAASTPLRARPPARPGQG